MSGNHSGILKFERYIKIGILLNMFYVAVELFYGFMANSIALITDAGHNFSDVLTLLLAWLASWLMKRASSQKFTYGLKKGSIHIALINSVLLLIALGAITLEAVKRLSGIEAVEGKTIIIVSAIGIVVNGITTLMFIKGRKHDLNIKSVFLHMLTDTLVSLGVLISGLIILYTGQYWIDPVISIIIVAIIIYSSFGVFRDSVKMSLDAVPAEIETSSVMVYLSDLPGVINVHDLHIWSISTSHTALTVHLIVEDNIPDNFLNDVVCELNNKFRIDHPTLQIEKNGGSEICRLGNCISYND